MKKSLKKIVAFLLSIAVIMSCSVFVFAYETENLNLELSSAEEAVSVAESEAQDNEIVARFYLMSCMYIFPISGHTWIYVENLSDEPIQVGLYEVPVGEGVSIGSYCFTAYDGPGLYYNLEAHRENKNDNQDTHYSIATDLNKAELKHLSDDIAGYVNYWDFYFNCAFFSFSIYNGNSNGFLIPLVIPGISQIQVILAGGKQGSVGMFVPTRDQVLRQKGSLDNAELVPVCDKTFDR